ncbi:MULTISPECIES: TauD/TfdA family dioxygenase [unclassified Streptomyces]|uniref:TauD/TfdA family dioxygenase n=1 Tax=unclassified Streptomyces TaxID=2593676 RepID=UPI00380BBACD
MHSDIPLRTLPPEAAHQLVTAAGKLLADHGGTTGPELFASLGEAARQLHSTTRDRFRAQFTDAGMFVVRGLPVDDEEIGPTPLHWSRAEDAGALWDVVLLLVVHLMGRPLAWEGQQSGRIVNNIVPSEGHEHEQTGASSTVLLSPHTEDAFHPQRAHLLLLCCMRNHDRVATTAASVRRTGIGDEDLARLTMPVLPILPDDAYESVPGFHEAPPPVRTLWDSPEGLTLRFDPAYTPLDRADQAHRDAYRRLEEQLAAASVEAVLEPGDVLVVDNDVVVHGRVPFRARYDGTDRWLKRALVRVPARDTRPPSEQYEHGYGQSAIEM